MLEDIALFGVGSDGSVPQWDGLRAPAGILLRWFAPPGLDPPDYGFDLERAKVDDVRPIPFDDVHVAQMAGQTAYELAGEFALESDHPFQFQPIGAFQSALIVMPGQRVTLRFPDPAWYLRLQSFTGGAPLRARMYAGGMERDDRLLRPGGPIAERVTRGVERVDLTAEGSSAAGLALAGYRRVHVPLNWARIAHLCLPVTDSAYPCRPAAARSDEDEARSRVPPEAWADRYRVGFAAMLPTLRALATRAPAPPLLPASTQDPDPKIDGAAALRIAALDPHVARIIGLAYDDPVPLDGQLYAYRVLGRWRGERTELDLAFDRRSLEALQRHEITIRAAGAQVAASDEGVRVAFQRQGSLLLQFPKVLVSLTLGCSLAAPSGQSRIRWTASDERGSPIVEGVLRPGDNGLSVDAAGTRQLRLAADGTLGGVLLLSALAWSAAVEHIGLLPGVAASEPGPPSGPGWLTVQLAQPGGTAGPIEAALDWDLRVTPDGSHAEQSAVFQQVAAAQLGLDPSTQQPPAPQFSSGLLLRGGTLVSVPPDVAAASSPRRLLLDRGDNRAGLREGWRCWWARGVDLFGRASPPTAPFVQQVVDGAQPPAPSLLLAEYVQADLPPATVTLLAQSGLARAWRAAHPDRHAVVAVWAWTPELEEQCPDVDGFRLHVRRPVAFGPPRRPQDPETTYEPVGWGTAVAETGPVAVRLDAVVTATAPGVGLPFTVAAVTPLDATHANCSTTLTLDGGTGAMIGALLVAPGGTRYRIIRNGEGPGLTIDVEHNGTPPQPGAGWTVDADTTDIATVTTDLNPPGLPSGTAIRRFAGALVAGGSGVVGGTRLVVLGATGGTFVCRRGQGALPAAGTALRWYPAWAAAVEDTGFGPASSPTVPVAHAQVAAVALRRWATRPVASQPGTPGGVVAVDAHVPDAPELPTIPTGPHCAEVATPADWYGLSRFTLAWPTDSNLRYVVYRALGDTVMRRDLAEHTLAGGRPHNLPEDAWASDIWTTSARRTLVEADLAALDQAIARPPGKTRDAAVAAAYDQLHADTQRIIAGQPYARPAFTALHGEPLVPGAVPFTDQLDGRSQAHWFYRVAARSRAGLESQLSPPTPPICCPDVVAPSAPTALLSLADDGAVKLRWLSSPDADLDHYDIYAAREPEAAAELARMMPVAVHVPAPPVGGVVIEQSVARALGKWCFWIVALDRSGNRSAPSAMLRGQSLRPPPEPPVWVVATRAPAGAPDHVVLLWNHASDQRLACLVERRPSDGGYWAAVSGWLPRGTYEYDDRPGDLSAAWQYRLRVRDPLGQVASVLPTITLEAA